MQWTKRLWRVAVATMLLAFATGCFSEPPDSEGPDGSFECDSVGIRDLLLAPATPIVGTEFEFQWTRVGFSGLSEGPSAADWIAGNSEIAVVLEGPAGFSVGLTEPFDYSGFGPGQGTFEEEAVLGVADLTPTFVDLEVGEYSVVVELVSGEFPICPPPDTFNALNLSFQVAAATSCVAPDVTRLDLEVSDLALATGPPRIEWTVNYLVEAAPAASPGSEATLSHAVTVTDPDSGDVLGSETVNTAESVLPGESLVETLALPDILDQAPDGPITVLVEVTAAEADAECGAEGEDLASNNSIEVTAGF